MDNPKLFAAMLNGVLRRVFDHDESITPDFLKEQVFAEQDTSVEDIEQMMEVSGKVMSQAAYKNWDLSRLEALLTKSPFSEEQQEIFIKFWKLKKPALHEKVLRSCKWNDSLRRFAWRIDVKTKSRRVESINEPTAIVELNVGQQGVPEDDPNNQLVRFEMSREQLKEALQQIEAIESKLSSFQSQE